MVKISVPQDIGGDLRILPEDTYRATIQDVFYGVSKSKQPKLTVKWVVQSEYSGKKGKGHISTIGENVLETFSLQPQALWNLNTLYKDITGEKLPHGDFTAEEFTQLVKDAIKGAEFDIDVGTSTESGEERSTVMNRIPV